MYIYFVYSGNHGNCCVVALKTKGHHDANFVLTGGTSDDKVGTLKTLGFQWDTLYLSGPDSL